MELGKAFHHLGVGEPGEIGARDDARTELELVGDGTSGDGVVAGDHADVDPGVERDAYRLLGLCAQRVDDSDQGNEGEPGYGRHGIRHRA